MLALVIFMTILFFVTGVCFIKQGIDNNNLGKTLFGFFIVISSPFVGMLIDYYIEPIDKSKDKSNVPRAIDVYRGKTTLQITYQDSIPVDSIVVFKDKEAK